MGGLSILKVKDLGLSSQFWFQRICSFGQESRNLGLGIIHVTENTSEGCAGLDTHGRRIAFDTVQAEIAFVYLFGHVKSMGLFNLSGNLLVRK
jgi:hypothetical protein